MKRLFSIIILAGLACSVMAADRPIRVTITTAGHDYAEKEFNAAFDSIEGIEYKIVAYPEAEKIYKPEKWKNTDVFLFYDMYGEISEEAQKNMVAMLQAGKGVVAMHHCVASFPKWEEFPKIIGCRWFLKEEEYAGKQWKLSTYKHDEWVDVKIEEKNHPVTQGLDNMRVYDEVYNGYWIKPDVKLLLSTDHPLSAKQIAFTNRYGASRIIYIQSGHGPEAFDNPKLRRLIKNAIEWTSKWAEDQK